VKEDVVLRVNGRAYRFEQVQHERCRACGERIFDLETSRLFDDRVLRRRKSHAA
jgi:YgiT-type zinc finger domain-containing protein